MNDGAHFQAANIHRHLPQWQAFIHALPPPLNTSKHMKAVLRLLRRGATPQFTLPDAPSQRRHPRYTAKRAEVVRLITIHMPALDPEHILSLPSPHPARFPNLKCTEPPAASAFITSEIAVLVQSRRAFRWWFPGGRLPTCILPLGCVQRPGETKWRLIYDGRYLNMWELYIPFEYETLDSLLQYLQPGAWMTVQDFTAGYHAIACPELAEYLGFEWQGQIYVWGVMPFGWAPACRVFTQLVLAMHRPARTAGICSTIYIDDRFGAHLDRDTHKFETRMHCALMAGLGWFLSIHKCVFLPLQLVRFLGYYIDSLRGRFTLPEEKVDYTLSQIALALDAPNTPRLLSQIAGRLLSARYAIPMAPLFCRALFDAIRDARPWRTTWDSLCDYPEGTTLMLRYWHSNLRPMNGARIWKRQHGGLIFAGDASDIGYGGTDLTDALPGPVQADFTSAERARQRNNDFSSTERELKWMLVVLRLLVRHALPRLQHQRLRLLTDSQAALLCVMGMKGNVHCFPVVLAIWDLCMQHDIELQVLWLPREHTVMQLADLHSKATDESSWALHRGQRELLVALYGPVITALKQQQQQQQQPSLSSTRSSRHQQQPQPRQPAALHPPPPPPPPNGATSTASEITSTSLLLGSSPITCALAPPAWMASSSAGSSQAFPAPSAGSTVPST